MKDLNHYWTSIIQNLNEYDCYRKNISDRQSKQDNLSEIEQLALKKNKSIQDVQNFYRLFELSDLNEGYKERFIRNTFWGIDLDSFYDSFYDIDIPIFEVDYQPSLLFNRFNSLNYFEIAVIMECSYEWNVEDRVKLYAKYGIDRYSSHVGTVNIGGVDVTMFDIAGVIDSDWIYSFYAGVSFHKHKLSIKDFFELKPNLKSEIKKDNDIETAFIRIAITWIETIRNYESYAIMSLERKRYMTEVLNELRSSIHWYEFPLSTKMIDTLIEEILNFDFGTFDLISFIKNESKRKLFTVNETIDSLKNKIFNYEFDEEMIHKMNKNTEEVVIDLLQRLYPENNFSAGFIDVYSNKK